MTGRTSPPASRRLPLIDGYRHALARRDFRRLWLGASVSLAGDGMTFVALAWLVASGPGGAGRLGLLAVCLTAPVLAGGMLVGPLLDRFDKRYVLAADSVLRGGVVASVPVAAALGGIPAALPFVVAAVYGLAKMVPLAGVPAAIPDLVPAAELDAANALESLGFGLAGMAGPALGGLLVAAAGPGTVLALDAASYLLFAVAVVTVRRLPPPARAGREPGAARARPSALRADRVLVATTLAFMAFNVAEGMLLVAGPWLARTRLPGGPRSLGLLLAAMSAGELLGAAVAGAWRPRANRLRAIAVAQLAAAAGFLALPLAPRTFGVAAGFAVIGLFGATMTVWAQSLRMERIPAALRGRAFAVLRTLMQATPPVGAALVTPLLQAGRVGAAAQVMTLIAAVPALGLLALAARGADAPVHTAPAERI